MLGENQTQSTIHGYLGTRKWIYPREIKGLFYKYRLLFSWVLIFIYLIIPWINIGGQPLFLLDVLDRKLVIFGAWFWPQDLRIFLPLAVASVIGVVAVTSIFGRIWCGWACPQTVFLHFLFEPIERFFEGKALTRKRNNENLTPILYAKKIMKHLCFLLVSAIIANSFLAYFWGIDNVLNAIQSSPAKSPFAFGVVVADTLLFYSIFAWFKEQACVIVCPYARLQSTLYDDKTLIVGYDAKRGEPRREKANFSTAGDCVNCSLCVQVCPTGIDIRDGLQLECIGCAKCIDACDKVMVGHKKDPGLIRYASLKELEGTKKESLFKTRFWVYCGIITILLSVFGYLIYHDKTFTVDLTRTGTLPYFKMGQDSIANIYQLRIRNKSHLSIHYDVHLLDDKGRLLVSDDQLTLEPGQLKNIPVNLVYPLDQLESSKKSFQLNLAPRASTEGISKSFAHIILTGTFLSPQK